MKEIITYILVYIFQILLLSMFVDLTISICLLKYRRFLKHLSSDREFTFRKILRWEMILTTKIIAAMILQIHFHILKDEILYKIKKKDHDIEDLTEKLSDCYTSHAAFTNIIPAWYFDFDINSSAYPLSQSEITKFLEKVNLPSGIKSVLSVYDFYILNIKEIEEGFKMKTDGRKVKEYLDTSVEKQYKDKYQSQFIRIVVDQKYK